MSADAPKTFFNLQTTSGMVMKVIDMGQVIRDCQMKIATAYATKGDSYALVAVACASVSLQAYVEAESLAPDVIGQLAVTAHNLGLHKRLGNEYVDIALHCGPMLYDEMAAAYANEVLLREWTA